VEQAKRFHRSPPSVGWNKHSGSTNHRDNKIGWNKQSNSTQAFLPTTHMSDYRRAYVPGGCYFFTVVTHRRQAVFAECQNIDRLREGFRRTMKRHLF
jgi:hypothetical protein